MSDLRVENILIQVRHLLQDNNVKLWLAPYYIEETGTCDAEIQVCQKEKIPKNIFCFVLNFSLCSKSFFLRNWDSFIASNLTYQ